jgi:hypothetical protein
MQTTEVYARADPAIKLKALDTMTAPKLRSRRIQATGQLIAALISRRSARSPAAPA